jgi:cytochrome P450
MATKPTKVGPYRIPAGTVVGTPLFAIHNTVHNWDAPHEYRPERFLDVPVETYVYNSKEQPASSPTSSSSSGGLKHSTGDRGKGITFMPFSEGPRNCVGQSLAKMEVLTLLAKLLANFRVELVPEMGGREGVRSRESTHLTLQTAGTKGIRCHLHPRSEHVAAGVLHP